MITTLCLWQCLTSTLESEDEGLEHKRGCLTSATEVYFSCNKPSYRSSTHQFSFQCCKGDLCNGKDFPRLPPLSADLGGAPMGNSAMTSDLTFSHYLPILGVVGLLTLIFLVVVGYIMVTLHRRMAPSGKYLLPYHSKGADTSCGSYLEHSVSSGSGTGVPLLNRKTLGQKIELKECIGKGRFGSVYRGLMQGDEVSVKIFNSEDEMSFKRETEVYSIVLIRHDNVLCFLGSDILFERANVELWLVTAFHPLGSLHDFLTSCADVVEQGLDPDHAMDLVRSAVAGITHLHTEICGTSGKPAIAHRDIKSKNIILKTPRHCLIADFGLAVIRHDKNKEVSEADLKSSRVGTRRYMAPEVLALTMNKYKFQTYRQADIYSLGLVLWEIARCARNPTTGGNYTPSTLLILH
ncbi:ACVR1 [Cordylochernes scorpioides]|uniref:receptor protein serine/threonine kinase n=1 Tax=Cordylochernes scorpioides TaxID=51811 RepID=A0ABY6KNM4_9ARAC|nr:ACVR1 [Cordylochernes scorpioides]